MSAPIRKVDLAASPANEVPPLEWGDDEPLEWGDDERPVSHLSPAPKRFPELVDYVESLGSEGHRLATGFATLDDATRGGIPCGRLVIIGGAPGAGKTTIATQWANSWSRKGVPTGFYAGDEDAPGIFVRVGQQQNYSREELERGDDETKRTLREDVASLAMLLVDQEEHGFTIEQTAAELRRRAGDGPAVLICDSIQTLRDPTAQADDSARSRIDNNVRTLKRIAKVYRLLVVGLSEVGRGYYRSPADRIDPLAAFKESGGIEYAAALAIVLSSVRGEADMVDVVMPKNRLGRMLPFRLRLDRTHARFEEVPLSEAAAPEPRTHASHATLQADVQAVRLFLVKNPGIAGEAKLRAGLRAADVRISNDRVSAAIEFLRSHAELENRGSDARPRWHIVTTAAPFQEEVNDAV